VLRGEWFGGLSESMNAVVAQKTLSRLNLFRNSQGKTELLGTFPDFDAAKVKLKECLVVCPGHYVIYDQTGERPFAESSSEAR